MLADAAAGKTAIVEYIVLLVNNHMSESRPESYWPHLYWLTVLEEQKLYPGRGKAGDQQVGYQPENQRAGAGDR